MQKKLKETHVLPLQGATPEQLAKKLHSFEGRLAEAISNFAGSMWFVYFNAIWFIVWFLWNDPRINQWFKPFDPYPYGLLTMIVSLEAIFLATFIMINQNRQALVETVRDLEEDQEQAEEEKEQEELEEDVEDIQKDLDDIKTAIAFIQQKITTMEKTPEKNKPTK